MKQKLILCFFLALVCLGFFSPVSAQISEEILEGRVVEIVETGSESFGEEKLPFQRLLLELNRGSLKGSQIVIKHQAALSSTGNELVFFQEYEPDDQLRIHSTFNDQEERIFSIIGQSRRQALLLLLLIFLGIVLAVTGWRGLWSILALLLSFVIISQILIPMILAGRSPVWSALLSSILIIPGTFYLAHGFRSKTHSAVFATIISLGLTMILAVYFVNKTYLTGFATEEAAFVSVISQGKINLLSLLFSAIMIGALGVLDDISVGQASVVEQLRLANSKLESWPLFWHSMKVGRDHVASMINTLILVYVGASLPLLILFFDSSRSFIDVIELEVVAEEIVKTLVSSVGLIMAVPLTSFLSVFIFKSRSGLEQLPD